MSEMLQIGQHPDADQLSAFAEQALPPHEREATLAHLAVCTECRGVVAMALPPVEPPFSNAALAGPVPPRRVWNWLRGWRIVWVAVPALAAVVVVGIYLRGVSGRRREAVATQMAELRVPALVALAPPTPRADAPAKTVQSPPAKEPGARAVGQALARNAVESDLPANGRAGAQLKSPVAPVAVAAAAPPPFIVTASSMQDFATATAPAPVASATDGAPPKYKAMEEFAAARAVRAPVVLAPLPSGLPVLSLAEHLHQRLALDSKNALFVSEDDGRHWTAVTPKWSGRAVAVAMAAPVLPVAGASTAAFDSPRQISAGIFAAARTAAASGGAVSDGSLTGSVSDVTGAAIANARVTVTGDGGVVRAVTTDASGRYVVVNLPPGGYRIRAESPGFAGQTVPADVAASRQTLASLVLAVGSTAQTVTVEAAPIGGPEPLPSAELNTLVSSAPNASPAASPPAPRPDAKVLKARVVPLPVFVLTTETGERWTSSDGTTWKRE